MASQQKSSHQPLSAAGRLLVKEREAELARLYSWPSIEAGPEQQTDNVPNWINSRKRNG
tara:strand:+ start:795 stop:971 length:177 start_codon:yes stop_codon:yes gene_type:complete